MELTAKHFPAKREEGPWRVEEAWAGPDVCWFEVVNHGRQDKPSLIAEFETREDAERVASLLNSYDSQQRYD